MAERLIKSNARVKKHGEVFTPAHTVEEMLNTPGVKEKSYQLDATFFEPSAGEGAFVTAILARKLETAFKECDLQPELVGINGLRALASVYGVEFLADNHAQLLLNVYQQFYQWYKRSLAFIGSSDHAGKILRSARTVIHANLVCGNTLTQKKHDGSDIIFSQWKTHNLTRVKRTEFKLADMVAGNAQSIASEPLGQLDLFSQPKKEVYVDCKWEDVYEQRKENVHD